MGGTHPADPFPREAEDGGAERAGPAQRPGTLTAKDESNVPIALSAFRGNITDCPTTFSSLSHALISTDRALRCTRLPGSLFWLLLSESVSHVRYVHRHHRHHSQHTDVTCDLTSSARSLTAAPFSP